MRRPSVNDRELPTLFAYIERGRGATSSVTTHDWEGKIYCWVSPSSLLDAQHRMSKMRPKSTRTSRRRHKRRTARYYSIFFAAFSTVYSTGGAASESSPVGHTNIGQRHRGKEDGSPSDVHEHKMTSGCGGPRDCMPTPAMRASGCSLLRIQQHLLVEAGKFPDRRSLTADGRTHASAR